MSWSISTRSPARNAVGAYDAEAARVAYGRSGVDQAAIAGIGPLVGAAVKHAQLTDFEALVVASGHSSKDGSGFVTVRVDVTTPTAASKSGGGQ